MNPAESKRSKRRKNKRTRLGLSNAVISDCPSVMPLSLEPRLLECQEEAVGGFTEPDDCKLYCIFCQKPRPTKLAGQHQTHPTSHTQSTVWNDKCSLENENLIKQALWVCEECESMDLRCSYGSYLLQQNIELSSPLYVDDPFVDSVSDLECDDFMSRREMENNERLGACKCTVCCDRNKTMDTEDEEEGRDLKKGWQEIKNFLHQVCWEEGLTIIYDISGGARGDKPNYIRMDFQVQNIKEWIQRLCKLDPHRLYLCLESQMKLLVLSMRVVLVRQVAAILEESKKNRADLPTSMLAPPLCSMGVLGDQFLRMEGRCPVHIERDLVILWILHEYHKLCAATRRIAPILEELELCHLKSFNLTWELVNRHLFQSLVYSDAVLRVSLQSGLTSDCPCKPPLSTTPPPQTSTTSSPPSTSCSSPLSHSEQNEHNKRPDECRSSSLLSSHLSKLDDEMTVIAVVWREAQQLMEEYKKNREAKARQRRRAWDIFHTQWKIVEQEMLGKTPYFEKLPLIAEHCQNKKQGTIKLCKDSTTNSQGFKKLLKELFPKKETEDSCSREGGGGGVAPTAGMTRLHPAPYPPSKHKDCPLNSSPIKKKSFCTAQHDRSRRHSVSCNCGPESCASSPCISSGTSCTTSSRNQCQNSNLPCPNNTAIGSKYETTAYLLGASKGSTNTRSSSSSSSSSSHSNSWLYVSNGDPPETNPKTNFIPPVALQLIRNSNSSPSPSPVSPIKAASISRGTSCKDLYLLSGDTRGTLEVTKECSPIGNTTPPAQRDQEMMTDAPTDCPHQSRQHNSSEASNHTSTGTQCCSEVGSRTEGEESGADDSCSERSSSTSTSNPRESRVCDCCYCEVFGHGVPLAAPVSRNYPEIRERLRLRLNKRKAEVGKTITTSTSSTVGTAVSSGLIDPSRCEAASVKGKKEDRVDERELEELLRFINGNENGCNGNCKGRQLPRDNKVKKKKKQPKKNNNGDILDKSEDAEGIDNEDEMEGKGCERVSELRQDVFKSDTAREETSGTKQKKEIEAKNGTEICLSKTESKRLGRVGTPCVQVVEIKPLAQSPAPMLICQSPVNGLVERLAPLVKTEQPRISNQDNHIQPAITRSKKNKKKKNCSEESSSLDEVFLPKDIDLENGELDEVEKELEAFKRFCLASVPMANKEKVQVNLKDIVFKKKSNQQGGGSFHTNLVPAMTQ